MPVTGDKTGLLGAEIEHRRPALKALTSLRFFAALHVVVYHMITDRGYEAFPLVRNFVASGYTGIFLFFILSGFILAYNYREVLDVKTFWISRFARIYPVYLLALLGGFLFIFAPATPHASHLWARFGVTAMLLQAWYTPFVDSFNPPGWTLSVEAFFYFLFPFVLAWVCRAGRDAALFFCALYLAGFSVPFVMHAQMPLSHVPFELAHYLVRGWLPLLHLPMFLIGMYLGKTYLERVNQSTSSKGVMVGGALASLALLCVNPPEIYMPVRTWLLIMSYAALIYGMASVRSGWLTSRWMVLGGEISFSIYILQMPVMRLVLGVTRRLGVGYYGGVVAVLVTLIPLSFLVYRFVELPARLAIRTRLTHRRVPFVNI